MGVFVSFKLLTFLLTMLIFAAVEFYRLTPDTLFYAPPLAGKPWHAFVGRLIGDFMWTLIAYTAVKLMLMAIENLN